MTTSLILVLHDPDPFVLWLLRFSGMVFALNLITLTLDSVLYPLPPSSLSMIRFLRYLSFIRYPISPSHPTPCSPFPEILFWILRFLFCRLNG